MSKRVSARVDTRVCWDCPAGCKDRHHTIFQGQKYPQRHSTTHCYRRCKFMLFAEGDGVTVVWTEVDGRPVS